MPIYLHVAARKFGKLVILLSLFILLSIGLYWASNWLFSINTIEVIGDGIDVTVSKDKVARNLLFFPTEKVRQQLLSTNPLLADVKLKRKLPHTLQIVTIARRPEAVLVSRGRRLLLDKEGIVIGEWFPEVVYPRLVFDVDTPATGRRIADPAVVTSLGLISEISSWLIIDEITVLDSSSLQARSGKTNIFIPQQVSPSTTANTLQTLIAGFRIKGILPTTIDLRFDKPVISN